MCYRIRKKYGRRRYDIINANYLPTVSGSATNLGEFHHTYIVEKNVVEGALKERNLTGQSDRAVI